jgi:hypothetical protein
MKREGGAWVERKCQESPEILGEPLQLPLLHHGFQMDWSAISVNMSPWHFGSNFESKTQPISFFGVRVLRYRDLDFTLHLYHQIHHYYHHHHHYQ